MVKKKAIVTIELIDGRKRKKITYTFLGSTKITLETIREMVETESGDDARIPTPFSWLKLIVESMGDKVCECLPGGKAVDGSTFYSDPPIGNVEASLRGVHPADWPQGTGHG